MHRDSLISFISFIKDLYIFQAKPRQILSCAWLLGARSDVLLCSSNPDLKPPPSPSRACTRFPELEIRHQAHRAASGTNKWKENEAAANIAPAARSVPGVPSAQVLGAPSNNIRSAIRGSLCLNYIKKKKKNLCQVSTLHVVHHLAGAPSEAGIDCPSWLLTPPAPLKATAS